MPCYDGGYDRNDCASEARALEVAYAQVAWRDAALCALFSAMTPGARKELLNGVNWQKAGMKRADLEEWWSLHILADLKKKEAEAAQRKAAREKKVKLARKKALLDSMSTEDLEILGLKRS